MKKFIALAAMAVACMSSKAQVSRVDTSLDGSEKFVLRVDDKPFYMTNVQVRLDKMKANNGFAAANREEAIKVCAEHYFNTVSIPIHWREVEPTKDNFDWTILDEYMGYCLKYGIKMEVLWFSWSSGGTVQYLNSSQLRTPDYVCSKTGTSEFNVIVNTDPWELDWYDDSLMNRETVVVDSIIHHISAWDKANGNPHTVIGMQMGNEPKGYTQSVSSDRIIRYYSNVASVIKQSDYSIWTRINCVTGQTNANIQANEALRNTEEGTNIDFVGIDIYGTTCDKILGDCGGQFKKYGKNYMMIMESGAELADASHYMWSALRGGKAYDHYDFAGVDKHGLFDLNGTTITEHGTYVTDIANNNHALQLANQDVALKAQGKSMYVYNYNGQGNGAETGLDGISFTPWAYYSHALAVRHSENEYVLVSAARGTFTIPYSISVESISSGYFDENNEWVKESDIALNTTMSYTVKKCTALLVTTRPNAIENVADDNNAAVRIYNICGKEVTGQDNLPHGIYIEKKGDITRKIYR